jgi:hypothetical protein
VQVACLEAKTAFIAIIGVSIDYECVAEMVSRREALGKL